MIIIFFLFVKESFDKKTALTSALLFATLPIIWFNASSALADIPNLLLFLLGIFFITLGNGQRNISRIGCLFPLDCGFMVKVLLLVNAGSHSSGQGHQ